MLPKPYVVIWGPEGTVHVQLYDVLPSGFGGYVLTEEDRNAVDTKGHCAIERPNITILITRVGTWKVE